MYLNYNWEIGVTDSRSNKIESFDDYSIRLICINKRGNFSHFFHFYADLLMPLYAKYIKNNLFNVKEIVLYLKDDMKWYLGSMSKFFYDFFPNTRIIYNNDFPTNFVLEIESVWSGAKQRIDEVFNIWRNRPSAIPHIKGKNQVKEVLLIDRTVLNDINHASKSPSGGNRRRLANLEELYNALVERDYNVRVVELEKMSFEEQQKAFYNIDIVIAQHGAGLVHLADVKRKLNVIEMEPIETKDFEYMCMQTGLNYIKCEDYGQTNVYNQDPELANKTRQDIKGPNYTKTMVHHIDVGYILHLIDTRCIEVTE